MLSAAGYTVVTPSLLSLMQMWMEDGANTNNPHETHALLEQLSEGW